MATQPKDYDTVTQDIVRWLDATRYQGDQGEAGLWSYGVQSHKPWAVEASALAVLTLQNIRQLGSVGELDAITRTIQSRQEPDTGLFKDPLIGEADKTSDRLSWEHIWHHHTGVCVQALAALEAKPLYPMPRQAFADFETIDVDEWTLGLDWTIPWTTGEHWAKAVNAYRMDRNLLEPDDLDTTLLKAFATMETRILNPENGMPDLRGCDLAYQRVTGLFKLMFAYVPFGRDLPNPEKAIDYILSVQREDGPFDIGGMGPNGDAIWALKHLSDQLDDRYRMSDIIDAGRRLNRYLIENHQKPDGGFSYNPDVCWETHNTIKVADLLPQGDPVGTLWASWCFRCVHE
ncbi:hypothetical protein LCGC14_2604070, partial [marine sediment metagenome]